jgi:hypothetical protein
MGGKLRDEISPKADLHPDKHSVWHAYAMLVHKNTLSGKATGATLPILLDATNYTQCEFITRANLGADTEAYIEAKELIQINADKSTRDITSVCHTRMPSAFIVQKQVYMKVFVMLYWDEDDPEYRFKHVQPCDAQTDLVGVPLSRMLGTHDWKNNKIDLQLAKGLTQADIDEMRVFSCRFAQPSLPLPPSNNNNNNNTLTYPKADRINIRYIHKNTIPDVDKTVKEILTTNKMLVRKPFEFFFFAQTKGVIYDIEPDIH